MRPEARERARRRVRETLLDMSLQELRQRVSGITQTEVADLMKVTQGGCLQLGAATAYSCVAEST